MDAILSSVALHHALAEVVTNTVTTFRWIDSLPPAISTFGFIFVAFCIYMQTPASRRGMIRG